MSAAGLVQLATLALLAFALLSALVVALCYPSLRGNLMRLDARSRATALTALAAAPALGAATLVVLCFLPSLLGAIWPALDHCQAHHVGHPHFCLAHLPPGAGGVAGWTLVALALSGLARGVTPRVRRLLRSRRVVAQLFATATRDATRNLWVASVDQPIALTTGLLRARVLVSRGLLADLDAELLPAVLAHETAHAARRDGLRRTFAALASIAQLPAMRSMLLADLDLAIEQACDDDAGRCVGDRLVVARALLAVRRLGRTRPWPGAIATLSIGGSSLDARIEALLSEPPPPWRHARPALLALFVVLVAAADPLHHLAETTLGLFTR